MTHPPYSEERRERGAAEKRRGRALEAAVSVARAVGIVSERPVILADSNNTIVWLAPAPIVAKVGTSHFRDAELESLNASSRLPPISRHGAPIVAPREAFRQGRTAGAT